MTENTVQELRPAEEKSTPASASPNTKNYDQLIEERPALVRVIGGKEIVFPKFLPAKILFEVRKAEIERKKKGIKQSDEEVMWNWGFDLLKDILGHENFEHIMAYSDLDIVMEITMDALEYYGLSSSSSEDGEEGKAEEAEKEEQASPLTQPLSTSTPLTQTLSASTPESGTLSGEVTHPTGSETGDSTSLESDVSPKGANS